MNIDAAFLPREVAGRDLSGLTVVVFDVLRATTTIAAALAAGVAEIHIFADPAAAAARNFPPNRLLCGEVNCLPPPGFELGNSPRAFNRAEHAGRPMLLSTTNGTRALLAAAGAGAVLCGAVVNARAVADALISMNRDVLLLCAGTQGAVAMEDLLGAGAVISEVNLRLRKQKGETKLISDAAMIASYAYLLCQDDLLTQMRLTQGGKNVIAAGLDGDIKFAAKLNSIQLVGRAEGNPPIIRPYPSAQ